MAANEVFFALVAGGFAALASVFAKLAIDVRSQSGLPLLLCKLMLDNPMLCTLNDETAKQSDKMFTIWQQAATLMRLVCIGMIFGCNALMWASFTKALAISSSSVYVTVLNSAANFLLTAVLGILLFNEAVSIQWYVGSVILIFGVLLMHRGLSQATSKQKKD